MIFSLLLLAIVFLPGIYRRLYPPEKVSFTQFKNEIAAFKASNTSATAYSYKELGDASRLPAKNIQYFPFDPNLLGSEGWKKLGLTEKQIQVIINYRSKGGRFYRKEDLRKIYSLSSDDYTRLEPYISIAPEQPRPGRSSAAANPDKQKEIVELNSADSAALVSLPGIGPAFASRILKYRNRLGGFYRVEQLLEVYGLDSAKYALLKDRVRIDAALLTKIRVNSASFSDLKRLPYLNYKQVNAIIQYRNQHGAYQSLADLQNIPILDEQILRKIAPYLDFNDQRKT